MDTYHCEYMAILLVHYRYTVLCEGKFRLQILTWLLITQKSAKTTELKWTPLSTCLTSRSLAAYWAKLLHCLAKTHNALPLPLSHSSLQVANVYFHRCLIPLSRGIDSNTHKRSVDTISDIDNRIWPQLNYPFFCIFKTCSLNYESLVTIRIDAYVESQNLSLSNCSSFLRPSNYVYVP